MLPVVPPRVIRALFCQGQDPCLSALLVSRLNLHRNIAHFGALQHTNSALCH